MRALGWMVVALASCGGPAVQQGRPAPTEVVSPAAPTLLEQRTRERIDGAMSEASVEKAFAAAFDEIALDPEVSRAGSELFDRLGDDPAVARAGEKIVAKLSATPEFQEILARFRARHPNDFEEAFSRHTDQVFDSEDVDAALSKASDELMQRPRVERALDGFATRLVQSGEVEAAFASAFLRVIEKADSGRLSAAVGVPPGDARYEEAVGAYLGDPGRLERVMLGFAQIFGRHPAPRRAVASMLRSQGLYKASVGPAQSLLVDQDFVARSTRALLAVMGGADRDELQTHARAVMTSPAAERAMVDWLSAIEHAPAVTSEFAGAFTAVAEAPEFARTIEDVYFSARKTAALPQARLARRL